MRENRFVLLRDTGRSLLVYDRFDKSREYMHYNEVMGAVISGIRADGIENRGNDFVYNPLICKDDVELSNMVIDVVNSRLLEHFHVETDFVDDMVIVKLYYDLDLNIRGDDKSYVYREYDGTQMVLPEYDWDDSGMIESVYKSDVQKGWEKLPFNLQQISNYDNGRLQLYDGYIQYYNHIEWRYNKFDEKEVKRWLEVVKNIFN